MNAPFEADVVVLGSGFGGSLTALLLHRIGLRPVLIDRGRHPRFAIGESSTPVADLVLSDLTERFHLPRLRPLAKYGSWKKAYPDIRCGLKRGFSYFRHRAEEPFRPGDRHGNELLVAASSDDEHSDTHWHRADVDAFFAAEVRREGLPFHEEFDATVSIGPHGWRVSGRSETADITVAARFIIDATGEAGVMRRTLSLADESRSLRTRSRAIFAHFDGMRPWRELLPEGSEFDYPFPCDHAALHQVIDEGWMWQLRFDSGIVSAGFAIDEATSPLDDSLPIEVEWNALLNRYPSIVEQFASARVVAPARGLRRTGRMQRLASQIAGDGWAMLPNTAGFIDPLHSTGIAQTLCGVERLIGLLETHWQRPTLVEELARYETCLRQEFDIVDRVVAAGYASRNEFRLFACVAMFYFTAATTYERRRQSGDLPLGSAFLCADDARFREIVRQIDERLRLMLVEGRPKEADVDAFERETAESIRPFNHVGLLDPAARNMYRHTALPTDA
ncbi:MAG: tryptophan 7-halogenase [Planctomycetota bacterium]|nr:tryptophan 7-halogenase [Planctomycetaceae bacterium]MDQ3331834.1 tryptophan 7-halogenase [Planctomycetota bacterium]